MGKLSLRCPKGHTIPHSTENGECTPVRCAVAPRAKRTRKQQQAENRAEAKHVSTSLVLRRNKALEKATKRLVEEVKRKDLPLPDGASKGMANEGRLEQLAGGSLAAGKHFARLAFINDMPKSDADEVTINNWTDARVLKLLPLAVAEKEYMLKFGDDDQRERAADRVLAMNGRATKEGHLQGGAAIILHMEGGSIQLPYAPSGSSKKLPETVDAEVTSAKKSS